MGSILYVPDADTLIQSSYCIHDTDVMKRHRRTFLAMVLAYTQTSHVQALITSELQAKNPTADAKKRANQLKMTSTCRNQHTLWADAEC